MVELKNQAHMYFVPSSSRNSAVLQMVSVSPVQQTAAGRTGKNALLGAQRLGL